MSTSESHVDFTLLAPLAGWSTPLAEVPDEVFARGMLGAGVAIDPTEGELRAPCDGEVIAVAAAQHAVTVRCAAGFEVLMHVGLDTVALRGRGFTVHHREGTRVSAGDLLVSFDLDLLAREARSLLTPVIVTAAEGFTIAASVHSRPVAAGEALLKLHRDGRIAADERRPAGLAPLPEVVRRRIRVGLAHGLHARPAALVAAAVRPLSAQLHLRARGREANARSTVALLSLGVGHGEELELLASGSDASRALERVAALLITAERSTNAGGIPAVAVKTQAATTVSQGPGDVPGVIASSGIATGRAYRLQRPEIAVAADGAGPGAELSALDLARERVRVRLARSARDPDAVAAAEVAAAHLELLEDPQLLEGARALIAAGRSAGFAWRQVLRAAAAQLRTLTDPRLRDRAEDLADLESQVLAALAGSEEAPPPALPGDAILIARELLPSQLAALAADRLRGIALAGGGATSHVAIIAAARGIPMLVALGPAALTVADGTALVLDAQRGVLETRPAAGRLGAAQAAAAELAAQRAAARAAAQEDCRTADGVRIEVFANIGSLEEAHAALANGAEGVGLLRTEFLFLDREVAPPEAEQLAACQAIATALAPRPLTIRTLDAGGDKPLAYLTLPREDNPALGLRGVRTSLAHPQLLRTQLRALLAVRPRTQVRLLLPMVSDVAELMAVRALLSELDEPDRGAAPLLGVMIETPASALIAAQLAPHADFFSVGTNDLTQYTLAMDRGNPQLAPRLDAVHPAVLRLIETSTAAARQHGRFVAVCGALASEPAAAALLVGLGVHELSVVPALVPQVKAAIRSVTTGQCRELALAALAADSAAAVRRLLS